jgi:hypothetical protein
MQEMQQRFLERNRAFVDECPNLLELSNKVFPRPLTPPNEAERESLLHLQDDDPAVIAFADRETCRDEDSN